MFVKHVNYFIHPSFEHHFQRNDSIKFTDHYPLKWIPRVGVGKHQLIRDGPERTGLQRQSVNWHTRFNVPGVMAELSAADSTWKRQGRLGGTFKLGVKGWVRVLQADDGGKGTQAEGARCAMTLHLARIWSVQKEGEKEEAERMVWNQIVKHLKLMH